MNSVCQEELNKTEDDILWEKYISTRDISLRNKLVERYMELVKIIAYKLRGIYEQYGSIDDVINEGIIALIDVIERFDITRGVKFETFATYRIKGSIIEFVKHQDWAPRRVQKEIRDVKLAEDELTNRLGREPNEYEIAEHMGLSADEYQSIIGNAYSTSLLSFEEMVNDEENPREISGDLCIPEKELQSKELRKVLAESILNLNKNEQLVISLYYTEELKFKEIAEVLDLTNSRVSQIHTNAIQKLKQQIEKYFEESN